MANNIYNGSCFEVSVQLQMLVQDILKPNHTVRHPKSTFPQLRCIFSAIILYLTSYTILVPYREKITRNVL